MTPSRRLADLSAAATAVRHLPLNLPPATRRWWTRTAKWQFASHRGASILHDPADVGSVLGCGRCTGMAAPIPRINKEIHR